MKKISYDDFWQRINTAADKQAIPLRVMFELTYECNFHCKHCYVPGSFKSSYRNRQLKTKQVYRILEQLKDAGCLYLGFTGGEPFTRPDFLDILEYARKLGFQSIIYTNGSLLDNKTVRRLSVINPNKIDITLAGMTRSVFESITGVAGSHHAVFKAIELLYIKKIPLGFKSCLLKENTGEIQAIKRFADSLGATQRLDQVLSCRLDGSPEPYQFRGEMAVKKSRKPPIKIQGLGECAKEGKGEGPFFFCGAGNSQAAITPAGELKLCLMIPEPKYDILKLSFPKAWAHFKSYAGSIKPDKNYLCPQCSHKKYCTWCPARGWLYNKNFSSCDPQIRHWLQRTKGAYVR